MHALPKECARTLECAFRADLNILFLVSGNSSSSESDGSFDAEEFQRAVQDLSFELLGKNQTFCPLSVKKYDPFHL